ncbi:unnamed protein product, partial [Amoebophrya sp. A25]
VQPLKTKILPRKLSLLLIVNIRRFCCSGYFNRHLQLHRKHWPSLQMLPVFHRFRHRVCHHLRSNLMWMNFLERSRSHR